MHKNYFLFEKQLHELKPVLLGAQVEEIFTFRKNELIVKFGESATQYLHVGISAHQPYFYTETKWHGRGPKFNLFSRLQDKILYDISIQPFDKLIRLDFDEYILDLLFYGKKPNVYLLDRHLNLLDTFKEATPTYQPGPVEGGQADFRTADIELLQELKSRTEALNTAITFQNFLREYFGGLNQLLIRELIHRTGIEPESKISDPLLKILLEVFRNITEEMNNGLTYIIRINDKSSHLSLIRLLHLETSDPDVVAESYPSVNQAWQRFLFERNELQQREDIRIECKRALLNRLDYLKRSIEKINQLKSLELRKQEAELKGNLLLTFKNQIEANAREVTLPNILSSSSEKIIIKLNPRKSVVENAQIYFNKFKNPDQDAPIKQIRLNTLMKELDHLQQLMVDLQTTSSSQQLQKIRDQLITMGLIQSPGESHQSGQVTSYAFKQYVIDEGWTIYIGKSAENNDQLTFHFAHKWDIWLHAQGVTGSHVIIRRSSKNQHVPLTIIEQAAQFAARHSSAKHSGTVSVIYCEVRFVSRIKNAPKGTVKTTQSKSIFVSPM